MTKIPTDSDFIRDKAECDRYKTNHILHFLISVISFGAWALVWLLITSSDTSERNKIHRKYNIEQEGNNAGLAILIIVSTIIAIVFIRN